MPAYRLRYSIVVAACVVSSSAWAVFPGERGLLTFTRYAPGNLVGQIASAPAEEDAAVTLLTSPAVPLNAVPAWAPDGSCIAFYSQRDGDPELYVMAPDGSNPTRLTVYPGLDYAPVWSPDGRQLAFSSNRDGDEDIFLFDLETGAMTQLTDNHSIDVTPSWSPDGETIAFSSTRDGNYEIYTMGAAGQDPKRRTENDGIDIYPDWSPDGLQIVFATVREGTKARDIWVMDAQGENQTAIVTRDGHDTEPAFSPDGKYIAFSGQVATGLNIFVVESSDGAAETQITTATGIEDIGADWQAIREPDENTLCPTVTPRICGDANADADVKATDALIVLRKAVFQPVVCPHIRCDTDNGGTVLASDAQRVLRFAVGQEITLVCPDEEPV